jgi:multisubunit Na+/H+ antiporter MnhC subunit
MAELFVYLAGILLTAGVYLVLQAGLVRMLFGVILIGNAMNLAIMAAGRAAVLPPPVVPPGAIVPEAAVANPLPQALVLTALVISFGLTAFALALVAEVHARRSGTPTDSGPESGSGGTSSAASKEGAS